MAIPDDFGPTSLCTVRQLDASSESRAEARVYEFAARGHVGSSNFGTFLEMSAAGFEPWRAFFKGEYENMGVEGFYACPNPYHLLVIDGSSAFVVDVRNPGHVTMPDGPECTLVRRVYPIMRKQMILLCGFYDIVAIGESGIMWTSPRLVLDGINITSITDISVVGNSDVFLDNPDLENFEVRLEDGHVIRRSQYF